MNRLAARLVVPGKASGELVVLDAPLSLWGGYDVATGVIIDATHPDRGASLAGRVLAMRAARGSSSSSSALVEAARRGTAPAAIILSRLDPILVIGALVAQDLYGVTLPIAVIDEERWSALPNGRTVVLDDALWFDGSIPPRR